MASPSEQEALASTMPAMPHPGGLEPDFNQHTSFPDVLIASVAVSFSLATVVLVLRLYTASAILRKVYLDDALIVIAWGCSLGYSVIMFMAIDHGFGKHLWNVTAASAAEYLELLGPSVMTYSWSVSITKLAMLVLYHRFNPQIWYRLAIYATALGIFGYQITFTYLFTGPCEPTNAGAGDCLDKGAIAQVIINIVFDVIVIIIPIPTIMSLNMPRKQRIILIAILALGSGAAIVSAVKVSWVIKMTGNPDFTYAQGHATILSIWEANVGIWCNNLVRLKPFVRQTLPRLYAMMDSSGHYGNNSADPSAGRSRTRDNRKPGSNHELSTIGVGGKNGAIPLGSSVDLTSAKSGGDRWITVTTDYRVDSQYNLEDSGSETHLQNQP